MGNNMKIVVTPPFTAEQKEMIRKAAGENELVFCEKPDLTEEILADAEVVLGNLDNPAQLKWTIKLKWIQLNNAGTEGYCVPGALPEGAVLTNATGAYGLAISEYMVGCLFVLRKKLHQYHSNQLEHKWQSAGHVGVVQGTTVLVLGLGDIGRTFAGKMKAFGCYTIGVKRRMSEKPAEVDELYTIEDLDKLLPRADVIAMSMPGNASTRHTLNRERIGMLKENAVVINVGRGPAIDTDALSDALYAGKLAGAALDVTDPEPLPADHPIWDAPGALITPHTSGGYALPETLAQIAVICAENLERYLRGEGLKNVIDLETGYCK